MRLFPAICLCLLLAGCSEQSTNLMAEWDKNATGDSDAEVEGSPPEDAPADPAGADAEPAPEKPKLVPITKREAKLVDKEKAMAENPSLIEVENKINAGDPLTAVAQGYFTIGSQAQLLAMKRNIEIQKEIDGHWPTFEEFEKSLKQAGVKLNAIYAYQMYAYDQATGGITILEDRAEKKRQYEAAGRDYPHDD